MTFRMSGLMMSAEHDQASNPERDRLFISLLVAVQEIRTRFHARARPARQADN
jgi:hypothetical protein